MECEYHVAEQVSYMSALEKNIGKINEDLAKKASIKIN